MTLDLLELRALADLATPAPWFARGRHLSRVPNDSGMGATLHTSHIGVLHEADDAAFAAIARTAVPELLDRVEALEAGLREALQIAMDGGAYCDRDFDCIEPDCKRLAALAALVTT